MGLKYRYIFGLLVLMIFFSSCGNLKVGAWQKLSESSIDLPENIWFEDSQKKALYKINIEAFHQKQGGILLVKQNKVSSLRLLMITEFGLKVFDVEYFKGDSIQLHYIMKHLDNPHIINALFDNLKVLWPNILSDKNVNYFQNERRKEFISRLKSGEEQWDYLMSQNQEIYKIERFENGRKRVLIEFDNLKGEILLTTKRPSISIRLKKITNAEE